MRLREIGTVALGTTAVISGILSVVLRQGPWYDGNLPLFQSKSSIYNNIYAISMLAFLLLTITTAFKEEKRQ